MEIASGSEAETVSIGEKIGRDLCGGELILLMGDLGAGKTVLMRGIAAGAGSADHVASPTYTLERVYQGRIPLLHIDLYRAAGSVSDLGIDDALASGCSVIVEWGERLPEEYERRAKKIRIDFTDTGRKVIIEAPRD